MPHCKETLLKQTKIYKDFILELLTTQVLSWRDLTIQYLSIPTTNTSIGRGPDFLRWLKSQSFSAGRDLPANNSIRVSSLFDFPIPESAYPQLRDLPDGFPNSTDPSEFSSYADFLKLYSKLTSVKLPCTDELAKVRDNLPHLLDMFGWDNFFELLITYKSEKSKRVTHVLHWIYSQEWGKDLPRVGYSSVNFEKLLDFPITCKGVSDLSRLRDSLLLGHDPSEFDTLYSLFSKVVFVQKPKRLRFRVDNAEHYIQRFRDWGWELSSPWDPALGIKKPRLAKHICGYEHQVRLAAPDRVIPLCPYCYPSNSHRSKREIDIAKYLSLLGYKVIINSRVTIPPHELDIYLPDLGVAIEFNGLYWHSNKPVNYHLDKSNACLTKGIYLYHVWEQWTDEYIYSLIAKAVKRSSLPPMSLEISGFHYLPRDTYPSPDIVSQFSYRVVGYSYPIPFWRVNSNLGTRYCITTSPQDSEPIYDSGSWVCIKST